jgi:hypothetical protein
MMGCMIPTVWRGPRLGLFFLSTGLSCAVALAQVNYSVHFEMEKPQYLLGEPIFCRFVIQNTGNMVFAFRYRTPARALASDSDQEPRFRVTDGQGRGLPDPGPRPCGSPMGSAVYGSVTLSSGQVHTERWLVNQWARFRVAGRYPLRAERRLALFQPGPSGGGLGEHPVAFALALDELTVRVDPSTSEQVEAAFEPYLAAVQDRTNPNPAEAVVVLTSLPQPFFFGQLVEMAYAGKPDRWDRRDALDGLARLGTPASWAAILNLFRSPDTIVGSESKGAVPGPEYPLWSYALLLLAEKGDPAFVPAFIETLGQSAEPARGDILRALGFFHDPHTYQVLFENLHSAQVTDRMNAVLALKNLGTREVIPALLAALNDPEVQVRQVASFALEGLTGRKVAVSSDTSREESLRAANDWHAWWRQHAATFSPPRPTPCHDW